MLEDLLHDLGGDPVVLAAVIDGARSERFRQALSAVYLSEGDVSNETLVRLRTVGLQ